VWEQDKEKRFAKGDIVLYRQHDGRIRRVEVVDVTEEEEEVKYSIELDASVRTTTADRLSHIPQVLGTAQTPPMSATSSNVLRGVGWVGRVELR
jgi:hypothetical protein